MSERLAAIVCSRDRPAQLADALAALAPALGPDDDRVVVDSASTDAAAVDAAGGFDEALGAGGPLHAAEDSDMFWRLLTSGWDGVHEPAAAATHVQWRSTAAALKISRGYGVGVGAMAVKGIRAGRPGGAVLRRALWDAGLVRAWTDLRNGYQTGVASALVRMVGVVVGAGSGLRRRVHQDRFE